MNVHVRTLEPQAESAATTPVVAASRLAIADCDIHPAVKSPRDLHPYLAARWIEEMRAFGGRRKVGVQAGPAYPKSQPNAARRDAWPEDGSVPGSDLGFLRSQLLDPYNVQLGVLNAIGENGQHFANRELAAAYCRATNHWQIETFTKPEPRLKASLVVHYEAAEAGVAEIEHWAADPNFVQIILQSRSADPLGNKRYWPVYEAAAAA
ncbi:MAG: amidohydrolase family protein, partial [Acetobacteraceae bacterium]|nr:amidohydrolase family protein [Acetobacteraceae bacterium]